VSKVFTRGGRGGQTSVCGGGKGPVVVFLAGENCNPFFQGKKEVGGPRAVTIF